MEIGIFTFAETTPDPFTGRRVTAHERLRNLLEEAELAEEVGLDVFGVGEHHRAEFAVSTPAVVLAAVAARTRRMRLTSAVTVLSSDGPVRVFQEFATLDLLSDGRAEIMADRGSFIESFPLFGYRLEDYNELFEEKLDLLLKVRASERVSWSGRFRAPIDDLPVYPRPLQDPLPVWIAVGGTPASVVRAGRLGLPLAVAIIGGQPVRFRPLVDLYRDTFARTGHPGTGAVSINGHTFVADDSQRAADEFFPPYAQLMSQIGRERGWPPLTREQFEAQRGLHGALLVGSPQQIIDKILYQHEIFRHDRFLAQYTVGAVPHASAMRSIELLGTVVAPAVRKALGGEGS